MGTENKSWLECLNTEEWGIDDAWLLPGTKSIYAKNLIVHSTDIRRVNFIHGVDHDSPTAQFGTDK